MSSFGYDVLGFGSSATTGVVLPSDDEFNRVSFLSHFDGANNGVNNAFDDGSTSNHTITANGNVTQGSFGPFARPEGEWAVDFKNTSALALPASSTDFDFGTANFTIECYMRYLGGSSDDSYIISFGGGSGNAGHFGINIYQGNWRVGAFNNDLAGGTAPTDGDWHHIAVVYVSNVFKLYVDGSVVSTSGSNGPFNTTTAAVIGGYWDDSDSNNFNGLISNLRVVKGTAVYTSNFTAPTAPLTAISGTVLLTCQSNRFVDNSASAHTITPVVSPAVSAFGPFLTDEVYDPAVNGASAYFDGTGDYLSVPNDAGLILGTDNFTIEFWAFPKIKATSDIIPIVLKGPNSSSADNYPYLSVNGSGGFLFNTGAAAIVSDSVNRLNQWSHVAAVRNGSLYNFFVNGVSVGTSTNMKNFADTNPLQIGYDGIEDYEGYLQDVRVVKGTAVYTSNFTPPTAPLTAITNTKLLLNMADGQAIDSAAQNNLTLYGNAKLSTTQSEFGDTSLALDGNGDYAALTDTTVGNFGAGNFTIECWFRSDQFDSLRTLASKYTTEDGKRSWRLVFQSSAKLQLDITADGGGSNIQNLETAATFNANTWYHLAVVRNGATISIYINGTADNNTLNYGTAIAFASPTDVLIGSQGHDSGSPRYYFDGYIDEFRISNLARYTNNFTAPTEPFADKGQ